MGFSHKNLTFLDVYFLKTNTKNNKIVHILTPKTTVITAKAVIFYIIVNKVTLLHVLYCLSLNGNNLKLIFMNSKVFMVIRILLGLFVLVFGFNKFFHFIPMEAPTGDAGAYFGALMSSKTLTLVAIVEIAAGLALIFNKFGALMSLILMSVSVNAVLFHATLDPAGIMGALVLLVLNIIVLIGYKDQYKGLFG